MRGRRPGIYSGKRTRRYLTVSIVTDSSSGLAPAEASAYGIGVVRGRVVVGNQAYRDGELPLEEVFAHFDEGVSTTGPGPADFLEVLEQTPGEVLVPAVTGNLSSATLNSALLAAAQVGPRVRVLDTGTSAGGLTLVCLHAARSARAGGSLDQVEKAARQAMADVRLVAQVGALDYLIAGGRMPASVGKVGKRLGMRPVVQVYHAKLRNLRPAFSKEAADERIVGMLRHTRRGRERLHVAVMHVLAEAEGRALLARVREEFEPATEVITRFGAIMVAHTGPELTGLSWWWE